MVTLLITSVLIISLLAVALYFWQRPRKPPDYELPPPPDKLRGLFDPAPDLLLSEQDKAKLNGLIERAHRGDLDALKEVKEDDYHQLLSHFVSNTKKPSEVLSLCSFLTRNQLPLNNQIANAFIDTHQELLDRNSVSKMLHIAALSNDAAVFSRAVELSLATWRDGRLSSVGSTELQALFNGEYWLLSSSTRSSGAGFVLKRTLANARRELEESINNQPSTASS